MHESSSAESLWREEVDCLELPRNVLARLGTSFYLFTFLPVERGAGRIEKAITDMGIRTPVKSCNEDPSAAAFGPRMAQTRAKHRSGQSDGVVAALWTSNGKAVEVRRAAAIVAVLRASVR